MASIAAKQLLAGGILAATFLGGVAFAPALGSLAAAQLSGGTVAQILAHGGPLGSSGVFAAAAAYIGISETALRDALVAGKSLAEIAVENGKTRDGLIAALRPVVDEQLAQLVDRKGVHGPKGPGPAFGHVRSDIHATAAAYLGLSAPDLLTRLRAGETLGAIADSIGGGKSRAGLIAALVAAATADIQRAQTNGRITGEQAAQMIAGLEQKLTRLVDATHTKPGPRGRR